MENNTYTVEYFIKKFEAIPENKWHMGNYSNPERTKFCAVGHCGRDGHIATDESRGLNDLCVETGIHSIPAINDGINPDYPQSTPKQRILALLYKIKAQQQPTITERIVYVTVDAKLRELQKLESL